jgi:hypothetical protein
MLIFLFSLCAVGADQVNTRIIRKSKPVAAQNETQLVTNVVAFTESASVNLTAIDGQDKWREVLDSDSFIHVIFAPPKRLRVFEKENEVGSQREACQRNPDLSSGRSLPRGSN